MKKVYVPVYIIEWSDVRPYVLLAAHYGRIGLERFVEGSIIVLTFLWRALCVITRWMVRFLRRFFVALGQGILNLFTVSNPRGNDDEEEVYEEEEKESGAARENRTTPRSIFDED